MPYSNTKPMKLVVLDGFTLNSGDLSWAPLSGFGQLVVHDRTAENDVVERCREAAIVITNKVPLTRETMQQLPQLKLITVLATGYNIVDVDVAKENGIVVCNVPAYGTASVAQHTFALLLELTNHVGLHAQTVAAGEWQRSPDFAYTKKPLMELEGKILGIVGFGNIGQRTARIGAALGMHILYNSRTKKETSLGTFANLPALFSQSDVVSLHCPLTAENKGFVNNELLGRMKPSAFFINTARGQLINEQHLANALNAHKIAGAALDVLSAEPPQENNPLLQARNCILTPHIAWISFEARQRIMDVTAQNIAAFLNGASQNVVNP
jgi:glycerate dehydrogenase